MKAASLPSGETASSRDGRPRPSAAAHDAPFTSQVQPRPSTVNEIDRPSAE